MPELLKVIVGALVGGKEMHDNIPEVDHHPALPGLSLFPPTFMMLRACCLESRLSEGIQHPIAGPRAQNEEVRERSNVPDVQEQDVFALLGFQGLDDRMCQFNSVQMSPLELDEQAGVPDPALGAPGRCNRCLAPGTIQAPASGALKSLVYREPDGRSSLLNRWTASTLHRPISPIFVRCSSPRIL